MKAALSHLRSLLWMIPLLSIATIVMGVVSLIASLFDRSGRLQHEVASQWGRMLLDICLVKARVVGQHRLDEAQSYVFVSNHFSLIDTPLVFGIMPRQFRILARHNLWRIPFLGWHLNRAGHIPINRARPGAAGQNVEKAVQKLREGVSILIFPEARRARDEQMLPFKTGAARIAIAANAPIVPMAIVGTRRILPPGSTHLHPGSAEVRIGHPIATEALVASDARELTQRLRVEIEQMWQASTWS